ncbi:MAG: winged helix-turn-helix domain-containing protein [Variovorax sp.]
MIEKRELAIDGLVQRVQPRVFDLLLYLVQHRDRVVTREELLRQVWKTEHMSESVIGRCIMKARRAIGDIDSHAPIIRTLPRAGYRFVGDVVAPPVNAPSDISREPVLARSKRSLAVATLPFRNCTGRDELLWVEFGLAALINRELEAQRVFAVVPIIDVINVLRRESDGHGGSTPVQLVADRLGACAVVAVEVHACEAGYELRHEVHYQSRVCDAGTTAGPDLSQLTVGLGRKLSAELAMCSPPEPSLLHGDAFTAEAFSRALRAAKEQRFKIARDYLEVCVVAEPHPLEMDVAYVDSLAAMDHPETHAKAEQVLARAAESADVLAQVGVLRALSCYHYARGSAALARSLIQRALTLAGQIEESPLAATISLERSDMAIADREFDLARSIGRRVLAVAKPGDEDRLLSRCLRQEGVIAHLQGYAEHALDALCRSAKLSRMPPVQHADLARTLHRIAIVYRDAGRMQDAMNAVDEAVDCARTAGMPVRHALSLAFQLTVHSYAGNQAVADDAYARLESVSMPQSLAIQFLSQSTGAWLSWRAGHIDEALARIASARALAGELRYFWLSFGIFMNTGMAIAGARYDLAREMLADMEAHWRFYENTCLQGLAGYFRAALAHAQGDRVEAWRSLRDAIRISSTGIVRSNACLAAAWLACEERSLDEVPGWLAQVPAWTEEHPLGIMALARFRFEAGDWDAAAAHQARYVEHWPQEEVTLSQRQLQDAYRAASITKKATAIARLPHLLTLRF